jgi:hypothetical protein
MTTAILSFFQYQIQCSYETVVRFFHKQGYALKTPWPDKQDEQLREAFLQRLQQLFKRPDMDNASWHKRKTTNWHN